MLSGSRSSSSTGDSLLIAPNGSNSNTIYYNNSGAVWKLDNTNAVTQSAANDQWHSHTASIQSGTGATHYNIDGTIVTGTLNASTSAGKPQIFGVGGQTSIQGFSEGGYIGTTALTDAQSKAICTQQAGRYPITVSGGNC